MTNPLQFLLNGEPKKKEEAVVEGPAFSLTKVLTVAAILLLPVVTYIVTYLENAKFTTGQVTALILGVLAFLAVASAADVLARGIATAAQLQASSTKHLADVGQATMASVTTGAAGMADAAVKARVEVGKLQAEAALSEARRQQAAGHPNLMLLEPPLIGRLAHDPKQCLTAHGLVDAGGQRRLLCWVDGGPQWLAESSVQFDKPTMKAEMLKTLAAHLVKLA